MNFCGSARSGTARAKRVSNGGGVAEGRRTRQPLAFSPSGPRRPLTERAGELGIALAAWDGALDEIDAASQIGECGGAREAG